MKSKYIIRVVIDNNEMELISCPLDNRNNKLGNIGTRIYSKRNAIKFYCDIIQRPKRYALMLMKVKNIKSASTMDISVIKRINGYEEIVIESTVYFI